MKNSINNGLLAIAFISIFTLSVPSRSFANDEKKAVKTELTFVGHLNDQPVFQLKLDNASELEFTITIRDEYQNILYRYSGKEESFNKKFLLNTAEIGDDPLRFEISVGKSRKPVVYEVNRYSRRIDEVIVNQVQ